MLKSLLVILGAALLLSCALTPAIYWGLDAVLAPVPWPYSRVFDRVILFFLVLLLIIFRRRVQLGELADAYGKGSSGRRLLLLLVGIFLSAGLAAAVVPFLVDYRDLTYQSRDTADILRRLFRYLVAAVVVSLLEESFFRVLLLRALQRRGTWVWAAVGSSTFYAVVHFIKPDKGYVFKQELWWEGFGYLFGVLGGVFSVNNLAPFLGFFLVGMVLCYAMRHFSSIYLCIGLHSGWVLAEKMSKALIQIPAELRQAGGYDGRFFLIGQPEAWLAVLLVGLILSLAVWWNYSPGSKLELRQSA